MSTDVLVPLAPGFEETEAVAVIDILRRVDLNVIVAGLEPGPIESAHGLRLLPDSTLEAVTGHRFQAIVLPGGLTGTERLLASEPLHRLLRETAEQGGMVAAICAAPTVLERCGLLQGRKATCHASKEAELASARLTDQAVVRDGNIITSRGVGTALAFSLELAARLTTAEKAQAVARAIHFPWSADGVDRM